MRGVLFRLQPQRGEWFADPYYEALLADQKPHVVAGFLGGNIAKSYELMGDPLPVP